MKKIILPALLWAIITCCACNVTAQNKQTGNSSVMNNVLKHSDVVLQPLAQFKSTGGNLITAPDLCNGGYQDMIAMLLSQLPQACPANKAVIIKKIKALRKALRDCPPNLTITNKNLPFAERVK